MAGLSRQRSKVRPAETETIQVKEESPLTTELAEELSSTRVTAIKDDVADSTTSSPSLQPIIIKTSRSSSSSSTNISKTTSSTSIVKKLFDETNGHATPKTEPKMEPEPEPPTKASRATSSKFVPRIAPLFDHLPDATAEAQSTFTVMESCTYSNKYLGYTEHAMECDCSEEWNTSTKTNTACGEDSDCINRATKMECVGDCACGSACQNQRFQRREYANVSVIKTEKKGHGLRTNFDLRSGDFIFEYIGEVINEPQFRRRMLAYDDQGIKHFYFMSLSKGEFVDATKKGNLGRFCNHSCNPNCYVDKWVVGDKLRMGIFAEKNVKAGEELVFNYNVDRYGANPQPCYCGESNCTGFIGGKTQTERATKLSTATIEALGIEDADSWDTVVAKKPRKKKTGEDDEDYVDSIEAKSLDSDGVTKVMAALMQCKEKWIAVKLLQRIQRCEDEQVRNRVVKVHGYQILNSQLAAWKEDENVVLQILDILDKFPRITRNKIVDSKIETSLKPFTDHEDDRVSSQATALLDSWSKLEVAYRIPRKKRDLTETSTPTKQETNRFERRESSNHERKRSRSRSRSRTPPRGPSGASAPSGPRSSLPQRSGNIYAPRPPPPFNRNFGPLPRGWFSNTDKNGKTYYYSSTGQTTWQRPTQPTDVPPPPPKAPSNQDVLKSIIDNIVTAKEKERETKNSTPDTPKETKKDKKEKKEEKWKSFDEDKKKKLYKNTLFPHISHVMNKYKKQIPKEDLKRFAKDVSDKLVNSDFKAGRVKDPTKLEEKHVQKIKKFCKDFFDKAAYKHKKHEQERATRKAKPANGNKTTSAAVSPTAASLEASPAADVKKEDASDDEDVKMSDEHSGDEEISPADMKDEPTNGDTSLKRKRTHTPHDEVKGEDEGFTKSPMKKLNLSETESPPPPPPPPAPPAETPPQDVSPTEVDTDIHADTSFKSKSMADVLAEAQQDEDEPMDMVGDGEGNGDVSMEIANKTFIEGVVKSEMGEMENPLVEGQAEAMMLQDVAEEEDRAGEER